MSIIMSGKLNLIIPKCRVICYNICLYQTLSAGIRQKADFMGKDLKGIHVAGDEKAREVERIESALKIV